MQELTTIAFDIPGNGDRNSPLPLMTMKTARRTGLGIRSATNNNKRFTTNTTSTMGGVP